MTRALVGNPLAPGRSGIDRWLAAACLGGIAVGTCGIGLLLSAVPADLRGAWGWAPEGAQYFKLVIPWTTTIAPVQACTFNTLFRLLLVVCWLAWVILVVLMARGSTPRVHNALPLAGMLALLLALLSPPVLSRDVLGYVAYGRIPFAHGLNPYTHGRASLVALGDPTAVFLVWDTPLPYGPLWTLMAAGLAALGTVGGLHAEIVAHKLVAAAALLGGALAGARLAGARHYGDGRATFAAIVFCPLLLLEGPATGHNDLAMMALMIWGAAETASLRWLSGTLILGLAIAVKPVAVAAAPLLLFEAWLHTHTARLHRVLLLAALLSAPTLLLSLPFGGPIVLFDAVFARATHGKAPGAGLFGLLSLAVAVIWGGRFIRVQGRTLRAAWMGAWIPTALVIAFVISKTWFPWYLTWAMLPALTAWDERHRKWTLVVSTLAVVLTWLYTVVP